MIKTGNFVGEDKMISLISENYRLLQVLSRFGIPLGFNDSTIKEVCDNENVDCDTFLTVINFLNTKESAQPDTKKLSLESLINYLKQSHVYFLDFCLPSIRRKLLDAISLKASDVSFLIIKLFDEYVEAVRAHMEDEERNLFKAVDLLSSAGVYKNGNMPIYSHHHEEVGLKLKELKHIIIKYCPSDSSVNLLNAALYDLFRFEEELVDHCKVEDFLLLPAINSSGKKL